MTQDEQLKAMRLAINGDVNDASKDDIFIMMLSNAQAVALNTLFPFHKEITEIDEKNFRLRNWQTRCAIDLYRAADKVGIQSYAENGLSITYFQSLVSPLLMRELVPRASAPKSGEVIND